MCVTVRYYKMRDHKVGQRAGTGCGNRKEERSGEEGGQEREGERRRGDEGRGDERKGEKR